MDRTENGDTASRLAVDEYTPPRRARNQVRWLPKILTPLASLRLTVALFVLAFILVFLGTVAQKDDSNWSVVNHYFRSGYVWIPYQVFVRFGQVFFGVSPKAELPGAFPYPGGWLLGGMLLVNLLAAHTTRFRMSWKRSGILLLHAGLIVMMLSELIAGLFSIEGRMSIAEGRSSNYLEDHIAMELAIIDTSDAQINDVMVIPDRMLKKRDLIRNDLLPFDVEVLQYMVNSAIDSRGASGAANPATAGDGLEMVAVKQPEVGGVKGDKEDVASAYVTLKEKGTDRSLGTYLVSGWFTFRPDLPQRPQRLTHGGKTYELYLRSKRTYKPYTINLIEFRHDKYIGTETPKNFSSLVHLTDPSRMEDREVLIYMNQPLRYAGETFYQSGHFPNNDGTILQVVRNPGWLMPYVSCAMVSVGMIIHFVLHLVGFIRRRAA
jgi:hypothetical protein